MKLLAVEKQLLVKEIWELSEDYDPEQPLHLQGWLKSQRSIPSAPIVYRTFEPGESLEPSLGLRAASRAAIGYWGRMMRAWKGR